MGKLNDLSKDPLFMDASPDIQKQAVKGVVNRAFTEKYGSDTLSKINLLPKEEQDAIFTGFASQASSQVPTFKGSISVQDFRGLDAFRDKRTYLQADTRSLAQKAFDESILSINATGQAFSSIGDGIVQGLTGYDPNIANALKIGEARDDYGWVQDASATSTGLVAGGLLGLAETVAPWALPSWYGATQGVMANQENDKAREEALKTGDWQQYTNLTKNKALAVGVNAGAGVATSFIPAHLGGSLTKKALTGAGLGAVQDEINNTTMNYASTGKVELQKPSVGLGTIFGAGFPLAGAGLKKLAGKRAKIAEAPSQKQAVEALQNEANNAPLASQRNRARATLGRMNTEYLKQPIQTTAKPASKPFKASLEAPQAVKKPVVVVPVKKKIKPPLQLPTKVVGGFKKKVTPAKVAKVEAPTKTTGKKSKAEPIKPSVVETRPKALKLNHDNVDFWVQKKWMRADGTLTASGVKSFEEAKTKKQFFDSPEGKQAIENKQKRIDGAVQWALDKTLEDPSKNGVFKTSGASKIGETLAKLAESKGDFSLENMRNHHYLTGETATHTWELEYSKGYNPDASYDDVGNVTLRFKEKPQETAVEAKVVEPTTAKGLLKNGDKAPPVKESESFDDYRARLEKQVEKGMGLKKESLLNGKVSLYEKTSKKIAGDKADADIEAFTGKPLKELSDDELLKASEHFRDKAPSAETTKANERIKKLANDRILEADAKGEDTAVLRDIEANAIVGLDVLTEQGKTISVKDAPTAFEEGIKNLKENGNVDVAKAKAEADAVVNSIEDKDLTPKAINKGTRDIDTQLQDLKVSQGTQPQTPDDIRRGAGVLMGHDSFLAKDTLEALGYPLTFSKKRKDANSTGWSVLIGGKKVELYPSDSLGGLLRRNKLESAFENGLVKKKAGDVVKGLIDDLDPNDLTFNETDLKQKLTAYGEGLPKDGGLLTSREAEAFTLLDNAKTPDELNAVERYVSERENDYQDGFHDDFYRQWNERHKAIEDGYTAGIENRVAKADETRQLKATEELKMLRKQLEIETNKVLKLENEMALLSPTVRLERTLQNDVLRDAKKVAKRLKGGIESGKIDDAQFTRIVEGLSPEARNALAEEFSC